MLDEMMLFLVENFTGHEDEELRNAAEKAWELLRKRGMEIESDVEDMDVCPPPDAKTEQELLEDMLEEIYEKYPEIEVYFRQKYREDYYS